MRDRLADGLVEIALGVGFVLTGRVFVTFGRTLSPETMVMDVVRLLLRLTLISLLLPVIVLLLQYVLARRGWQWPPWPRATWRRSLLALAAGVPLAVGIGYLLARFNEAPLAAPAFTFPALFGLLVALVPLGFAFVSGKWRYYAILLVVAVSGFVVPYATERGTWRATGIGIWSFTGVLFIISGIVRWFLFVWQQRGRAP